MIFNKLGVLHKSIMLIFYFCEFSTIECDNVNVKLYTRGIIDIYKNDYKQKSI